MRLKFYFIIVIKKYLCNLINQTYAKLTESLILNASFQAGKQLKSIHTPDFTIDFAADCVNRFSKLYLYG